MTHYVRTLIKSFLFGALLGILCIEILSYVLVTWFF